MKPRQIEGIRRLTYAFIPFICLLIFVSICSDLRSMAKGPVREINTSLGNISQVIQDETRSISSSLAPISEMGAQIQQTFQEIDRIPNQIQLPSLQIPAISLPLKPVVKIGQAPSTAEDSVSLARTPVQNKPWLASSHSPTGLSPIGLSAFMARPAIAFGFGDLIKEAGDLLEDAGELTNQLLPSIRFENIDLEMPATPSVTVALPGIAEVKAALATSIESIDILSGILSTIPDLSILQRYLQDLNTFIQSIIHQFKLIAFLFLLVIVFSIPFWISSFIKWNLYNFRTGWSLLRNPPLKGK